MKGEAGANPAQGLSGVALEFEFFLVHCENEMIPVSLKESVGNL